MSKLRKLPEAFLLKPSPCHSCWVLPLNWSSQCAGVVSTTDNEFRTVITDEQHMSMPLNSDGYCHFQEGWLLQHQVQTRGSLS